MYLRSALALMMAIATPVHAREIPSIDPFGAFGAGLVTIKRIRTGWDADQFAIETKEAIVNPANCPVADAYAAHAARPGYKEHYTAALTAMYAGRPVQVIVSDNDCIASRPRIMGLHVAP